MAKDGALQDYLAKQGGGACTLTDANVEEILGARLPSSAKRPAAQGGGTATCSARWCPTVREGSPSGRAEAAKALPGKAIGPVERRVRRQACPGGTRTRWMVMIEQLARKLGLEPGEVSKAALADEYGPVARACLAIRPREVGR